MECKSCKKDLDAHSGIDTDRSPEPGDLSVCAYCGAISEFDEGLNLKPLSDEELLVIAAEDRESFDTLMKASCIAIANQLKRN